MQKPVYSVIDSHNNSGRNVTLFKKMLFSKLSEFLCRDSGTFGHAP